jgi:hypothetical protein
VNPIQFSMIFRLGIGLSLISSLPSAAGPVPETSAEAARSLEIELSRIPAFQSNVEAYLIAFTRMIPLPNMSVDATDSNLIRVHIPLIVRFRPSSEANGLPDRLAEDLTVALQKLAAGQWVLGSARYSIPSLEFLNPSGSARHVDHAPGKRTIYLDATGYREAARTRALEAKCRRSLVSVDKPNRP